MTNNSEMQKRRVFLSGLAKLMFSLLILAMFWVGFSFVGSDQSSHQVVKSKVINLASFKEGLVDTIEWEGRPVLVLRRTEAMLERLDSQNTALLADPLSEDSKQQKWAQTAYRSRAPELFVAIATGTDYGCPVIFLPSSSEIFKGAAWPGGFKDSCRGSRYDLAGRVYADQNADSNLVIPDYRIEKGFLHLEGF